MSDVGEEVRSRRTALGMSVSALAKEAGVDRGSLSALEAGHGVRDTTIAAVQRTLADLEHELGMDVPSVIQPLVQSVAPVEGAPKLLRVEVPNLHGGQALVVEGPVDDPEALAAAVDALMRRLYPNSER